MGPRISWLPFALAVALLGGCTDFLADQILEAAKEPRPPADSGVAPKVPAGKVGARMNGALRTAPVSPTSPAQTAKVDEARARIDIAGARAAVREHQMVFGKNPPSIGALDLNLSFPGDLDYDPATGRVRSRTYPQY